MNEKAVDSHKYVAIILTVLNSLTLLVLYSSEGSNFCLCSLP